MAGAAAAAALSLILLMLGTGLGLSSISPWAGQGAGAAGVGIAAIAWITVTQLMSSGMGGYLAGRLRAKWASAHADEVYFRDTAHGFLAWAAATLVTAALVASALGGIVGGAAKAGGAALGGAATAAVAAGAAAGSPTAEAGDAGASGYLMDRLFRHDAAAPGAAAANGEAAADTANPTAEVARIFAYALRAGDLPNDDAAYAAQLVAQRTGLSPADAEKRVREVYAQARTKIQQAETAARDAADKARKATVAASLWLFISLLIGAFAASLAATYGGRQRDL